jgi:hypothetical protein
MIASLFDDWNQALATKDPETVANLYAHDAVLLPTVSNEVCIQSPDIVLHVLQATVGFACMLSQSAQIELPGQLSLEWGVLEEVALLNSLHPVQCTATVACSCRLVSQQQTVPAPASKVQQTWAFPFTGRFQVAPRQPSLKAYCCCHSAASMLISQCTKAFHDPPPTSPCATVQPSMLQLPRRVVPSLAFWF